MLSKQRKEKLEKNIWKYYLYRLFCGFIFIGPIFVLFLQSNGMSMTQVMILQSVYNAVIMLTIVPFGIIADYIGRKKVIVFSTSLYAFAWFIYGFGTGFWHYCIAEIVFALSTSSWFASGTPFFYDSLKELGKESMFKKLFGNVIAIGYISWSFASLLAGYIATYGMKFNFFISAISAGIALIISLSFVDTKKYKHREKNYFSHLKEAVSFSARHPRVRFFIVYGAILWAVLLSCNMFYQPYLQSIKLPLVYFGVIYAIMGIGAGLAGRYAHLVEKMLGEKKILLVMPLVLILSYIGMANIALLIGIIFPLITGIIEGLSNPVVSDYLHKHVESHHRATVNSLNTLVSQGMTAMLSPFLGWMFDVYSLNVALTIAAAILIVNLFILAMIYAIGLRNARKI
jgi:MFS family permease